MGLQYKEYLEGSRLYVCSSCRAHLALHDQIVSKCFQGRSGRAYLFSKVINVTIGSAEERLLITGLHVVADISCTHCETVLGWKYEMAYEPSQKYKEGKYIVEKSKILKQNGWC